MINPLSYLLGRTVESGAGRLQPSAPGTAASGLPAPRHFLARHPEGPLALLFRPAGLVLALLLLALGLSWLGTTTVRSWLRHADYARPAHADSSEMLPALIRQVPGTVTLTVRDENGEVRRLEINHAQLSAFVGARLADLEADR